MGWELPEMSSSSSFVPAFQITCLSQFTILTTFPFQYIISLGRVATLAFLFGSREYLCHKTILEPIKQIPFR